MTVYVWPQDMEPGFPLATLEYTVHRTGDPMHWHDYFEVALDATLRLAIALVNRDRGTAASAAAARAGADRSSYTSARRGSGTSSGT